ESTMHGTTGAYVSIPRKFIPGYTFDRGNESNILSGNILGDGSLELVRIYTANTNTAYTVRYMLDDGETVLSESTMHGTTGAYVEIPEATFAGYTFDAENELNVLDGNIRGDGKLVLVRMYTANTDTAYQMIYMVTDGTVLSESTMAGTTGAYVEIPEAIFAGYTFDAENELNVLDGNIRGDGKLVLVRMYTANTDTAYQMIYMVTDGTVLSESTMYGTTGAYVEIPEATFEGCTYDDGNELNVLNGNILCDGSLVLVRIYTANPGEEVEEEDPIVPVITDPTILPTEPETETGTPEDDATLPTAPVVIVTPPTATITNRRAETAPNNTVEVPDEETPLAAPSADTEQEDDEEDVSLIIGDPDVPLAGFRGSGAWALWNLIFSIAGALLVLVLGVHLLIRRRKRNDEKDDTEECDVDDAGKKRNRLFFVIAIPVLAIIAIILFILTENMRLPMIMIDRWTIAHIILFAVAVISYIFAFRTRKDEDNDDRQVEYETI
ncbi:MAG: hypothetical protein FWD05_07685, partial [Oscillospiraceae bacterium]|nr:hypothetical protein [Oscillospiraceae bacterium]